MKELSAWFEFSDDAISDVPKECGGYKIRSKKMVNRVKGTSDIVYIGINKKQRIDGLHGRIKRHIKGHSSASKYLNNLNKELGLQFAYIKIESRNARLNWEREQLIAYLEKHLELPPANSSLPIIT